MKTPIQNLFTRLGGTSCTAWVVLALFTDVHRVAAQVTLTVNPSVISNTYTGVITLQIGGIPAGDRVQIQKYIDLNGDGVIETNEPLFDSFYITDNGTNGVIGGVTNVNVPIDTDPATGTITTSLNFAPPLILENMVGHYVYQVISSGGQATAPFTVTNANTGQSVSGIIYSNGITPLPYGMVLALSTGSHDYAGTAVADSSGHYQLNLGPGSYSLWGIFPGYYFDQSLAPAVTLINGMNATNNLSVTNGAVTVSGPVLGYSDASTNTLGGVVLEFTSGNLIAFDFTDTNGNYSAGVSPNYWEVEFIKQRLARRAYVVLENTLQVDTTTNSVSNVTNILYQGNALFYGRITDNANNPLANIEFDGGTTNYDAKGYSDQNGNYAVSVLGDITNETWGVNVNRVPPNDIVNYYEFTNICVNQTIQQNFVCLPATAQISGQIQEQSVGPVNGLELYASATINGLFYESADFTTGASGDYTLGVASGVWQVEFSGSGNDSLEDLGLVDLTGPHCVTIPPTDLTLNITLYSSGTPLITQPVRLSPTHFGFNVNGAMNANYTVQVLTNLASTNWTDLQSFQLTTNPFPIVDVQATNSPRFYRVLENQ